MPTLLIQRGKGNRDYQEVGPAYPLQVEVRQTEDSAELVTTSHVYQTEPLLIPGIGTGAAYAAGDAFGTKFYFTVPIEGVISNVVLLDFDDEGIQKDLVLFKEDFTATADNSAFSVSDGDLANCIGAVSVNTFYNFGANQLGTGTPAFGYNLTKASNNGNTARLWCQVVTQGADNIAAGSIPKLFLVVS